MNPENVAEGHCKLCQATSALRDKQAKWCFATYNGRRIKGYWVPVLGQDDLYVHFSIGIDPETASPCAQPDCASDS
jgi:hypothetical protein